MSSIAIKIEEISKLYKLGEISTGTISHDLNRWLNKKLGKNDYHQKIGQINDRSKRVDGDYVWALKNIDFEINKGDTVGIIGSNGAGKSTLLKLLSKITKPTEGKIYIDGRISSLLEVGTGFHPEMTGKENIFMNGSILGMRKKEIQKELESIIEFSGVEKYIDTPIKRYSTGMKVRLGFAVAAHLRQEILIVDEVLAVGDAEFQKKCLGSMQNIGKQGRTVLFVSHNMAAIKQLCSRTIVLDKGLQIADTTTEKGIEKYLDSIKSETLNNINIQLESIEKDEVVEYTKVEVKQLNKTVRELCNDEAIDLEIEYIIKEKVIGFRLIMLLYDNYDNLISKSFFDEQNDIGSTISIGTYQTTFTIPHNLLIDGTYKVVITSGIHNVRMCKPTEGISFTLNLVETGSLKRKRFTQNDRGLVTLPISITTIPL
ncbi:MAG: ABC transporter ATP-binding protein [Bacteroidetes bacterium]|nr:ABC transporter ATP-binding protein [Bacteroidota bacterium]